MSKNFDSPMERGFCGSEPMSAERQRGFDEGLDLAAAFLRSKYGDARWDCLDFANEICKLKRFPEVNHGG